MYQAFHRISVLNTTLITLLLLIFISAVSPMTRAEDARSLAMGGASITSAMGAAGARHNPALMMESHRSGEHYHFDLNVMAGYRDSGDVVNTYEENEYLIDDIETEIDIISNQPLTCDGTDLNAVCVSGTQTLGTYANDLRDILNTVDEEDLDVRAGVDLGFMVSRYKVPFFFSVGTRATAVGRLDITQEDRDYAETLTQALGDNVLTLSEILNNAPLALNTTNNTVDIDIPDDTLTSTTSGTASVRGIVSMGFAMGTVMAGRTIDFGISPKVSVVRVGDIEEELLSNEERETSDQLDESENQETTLNLDLGAAMRLSERIVVGASVRNLVKEVIKTRNNVRIETTPQLMVSSTYHSERFLVTGDIALNQAKFDNYETQRLSLGTESRVSFLHLRAGIRHDLALAANQTDFTVGLGLGPLNLSAAFNGDVVSAALQIDASF